MGVVKVILNGVTKMDITPTTLEASEANQGDVFFNRSGEQSVGTSDHAKEQQIAYVESGTTASRAYSVGEYFCWNGLLYRVTAAISSGAAFTVGTNCESTTVGAELTGKAPAGYGLGMMTKDVGASVTDCNNIDVTGWFDVAAGAANRPSGLSALYTAVVYSAVRGPLYSYQEYYDYNTGKVYRRFKNTTWGAWAQI